MAASRARAPGKYDIGADRREVISRHNAKVLLRQSALARLQRTLERAMPGSVVLLQEEKEHGAALITKGRLLRVPPWRVQLREREPHRCHWNAARIVRDDPKRFDVMTGYAMHEEEGLWRQHSWVVVKRAYRQLIETTVPCSAYFGIRLTGDVKHWFLFAHRDD